MGKLLKKLRLATQAPLSSSSAHLLSCTSHDRLLTDHEVTNQRECIKGILRTNYNQEKKATKPVKKGYVPVVVNGKHRLLVKAGRLNCPLFTSLLHQDCTDEDFGYSGALRLSCDSASFHSLLQLVS